MSASVRWLMGVSLWIALVGGAVAGTGAPRAEACSAGSDFDPLGGMDTLIAGHGTDVEILGKTGLMTYLQVAVTFSVDRYLIGGGPRSLRVLDSKSATPPMHLIRNSAMFDALDVSTVSIDELGWDGSGGACGGINEDPRGRYWVVGFGRDDAGMLHMHLLSNFAVGDGPDDPRVETAIERVEGMLAERGLQPAEAGNAGLVREPPRDWSDQIMLAIGGLVLMLGARVLTHRV